MIGAIVGAVASVVGWLFSDRRARAKEQSERDRIAGEVSRGDEEAVNGRIGRFRGFWPWLVFGILVVAGCVCTRTVYVKEQDRAFALQPGSVHTNTSETVEWIVPRAVMTRLVIANEGLQSAR